MEKAKSAISLAVSAFIVIVIIVIAGFGLFLSGTLNTTTSTSISSDSPSSTATITTSTVIISSSTDTISVRNFTQSAQANNSTFGLELLASVNSTIIPSEDAITVSWSILNTMEKVNNVTAANDWPIQGLSSGSCDFSNLPNPAGIAIFRGYYGMNNLSSATEVGIWAEQTCPSYAVQHGISLNDYVQHITSYTFLPRSDSGTSSYDYTTLYDNQTILLGTIPAKMTYGATFYAANKTGFYNGGEWYLPNGLNSSLPATYTLVAGDEWGQIVLLHFAVTTSNNLPIVGEFLSVCECYANGQPVLGITYVLSDALIFNCARAAATAAGCILVVNNGATGPLYIDNQTITNPTNSITIRVWYPYVNQPNEPSSANCKYDSAYRYCLSLNSTAFVISPR